MRLRFQYSESMSTSATRVPATQSDFELFTNIESNLYTAVIADSLDELGYRQQAMREDLRPLFPSPCFAGWARTIACVDVFQMGGGEAAEYGLMLTAEILPWIAEKYRARTEREHTGLGGSSLGGLVTLYLGLRYAALFGKLAVLSPSVWWNHK